MSNENIKQDRTPTRIAGSPCPLTPGRGNKVKLCGYLKKKRNKVGGWRKMWFVLQDKLLLSYASKEEYDNKLVTFKDVFNLVPGTIVRPLNDFRFTIETTTNTMYTFHCEDHLAYRDWITMLLDSLTVPPASRLHTTNASYYSVDNLQQALALCSTHALNRRQQLRHSNNNMTHSYECMSSSCVRLPIAQSTAKILERNGGVQSQPLLRRKTDSKFQTTAKTATTTTTCMEYW